MFLQGDLQAVFDALFSVGAIDPVLKMDWSVIAAEAASDPSTMDKAVLALNACSGNRQAMVAKLNGFAPKVVQFIAVEVAREFAEYSSRSQLH